MPIKDNFGNPKGVIGKLMLTGMNLGHSPMAKWAFTQFDVPAEGNIVDIGCRGGFNIKRLLDKSAKGRGWKCLAAFGQRLRELHEESGLNLATHARAVATQTLREARNADEFLTEAQRLLGLPIAVISGHEEAALIYRGVSSLLPATDERRVVVDIGG